MEIHNINMKFSFYGLITRNLSLICIPRIVFMKTPRVSGERGKGERGKGKERRGKGGKGRGGKKPGGWIRYTIKIDIPLNHPAPLIILIDSKTRRGVAVLRKSIFIFFILFFLFSFFIFFSTRRKFLTTINHDYLTEASPTGQYILLTKSHVGSRAQFFAWLPGYYIFKWFLRFE